MVIVPSLVSLDPAVTTLALKTLRKFPEVVTVVVPSIVTVSVKMFQEESNPCISIVLAPVLPSSSFASSLTTSKVSAVVGHGYKLLPSQIVSNPDDLISGLEPNLETFV